MSTWEKYRDMIDLPYPGESKHTRMPVRDRAAQFAPFAALTGFGAVLKETERITEKRIELDEYEKEKLNENLRLLLEKQESRPEITVTFFVPDEKKDGGAYRTISGHIKRVDEESHCLILEEFCWKIFLISHSLLMKSKERRYKNVIKLTTKCLR